MFRELTKSVLSFSWALSLLGVKQAVNLGRPGQQSGDLFAPMTQAAAGQLNDSMKNIYRSGESIGSRAVDMAFWWMNPMNWMNPSGWMSWMNPGSWTRAAGDCGCGPSSGTSTPGQPGGGTGQTGATGWGPMPGAKS